MRAPDRYLRRPTGVAVALVIACAPMLRCGSADSLRHIVLISIDTLRADHVGCYGYEYDTTPRLDRLAGEGTRFRTAVSTSSWTLPAHMSMLTGLLPQAHGVQKSFKRLDPARTPLAEILREAGFRTGGFVSGPYVDARYGFGRGFETYVNFWEGERAVLDALESGGKAEEKATAGLIEERAVEESHRDRTGPDVIAAASDWLGSRAGEPFFLFVHLWEPHYDFIPPPPYDTMFVPEGNSSTLSMEGFHHNEGIHPGMPAEDYAYMVSQYDGEIAFTDHLIGKLLDRLAELGIAERTLVIVTSDHGEEFFEHGNKGHRKTLYDESILVPLIARGPGCAAAPDGIDAVASLIDIAPTILAACGLPPHAEMGGTDLGPLLAGGAAPSRTAVSQLVGGLSTSASEEGIVCKLFAARTPQWKAIRGCVEPFEIYHLAEDRAETKRVDPAASADAAAILAECDSLRASLQQRAAALPREGTEPVELSAEVRERLEALGYLD